MVNAAPAVAPAGLDVKANTVAVVAMTTTLDEVAVKLPALVLKAMFIVSALSYERPLKVATPPASVTVVVPWMVNVPACPWPPSRCACCPW